MSGAGASIGGKLINIDNGGTLTDICVIDGQKIYRTKTVTTPYDLSKCLLDGLAKVAVEIYGKPDLLSLLLSTDHIRYSTTQGTNALVERKGPRLGLIIAGGLEAAAIRGAGAQAELFDVLVGPRVQTLDTGLQDTALEAAAVRAMTALSSAGANRVIVAIGGHGHEIAEAHLKRMLLRKFPPHMLGAIPILYSHEIVADADDERRSWTSLFNAFLHPAMERFLYNAEHKLRAYRSRNPLLIFRNDGYAARVSKTAAIKTYSSGPRGGAEGARVLSGHYGFPRLLSIDVGGTTTDISLVEDGTVRAHRRGLIEGVETSFPLCNVVSSGVGGSSIFRVAGGDLKVGPESVGGLPGPACFGLGGKEATMTDGFLISGLLDPVTFFGGQMALDAERARAAIEEAVAGPLGLSLDQAIGRMEQAWVGKIASSIKAYGGIAGDTVLAAFGGAGPFVVCRIADAVGISKVLIPGLAPVFSAFGLAFSDIAHDYAAPLAGRQPGDVRACREALTERARRGMFAEGAALEDCRIEETLSFADKIGEQVITFSGDELPADIPADARVSLALTVVKPIAKPALSGQFGNRTGEAQVAGTRRVLVDGERQDLPLYRVEDQAPGVGAEGPAVLEEAFFTCRIDAGWRFQINAAGDIALIKDEKASGRAGEARKP
jgi:N-methylhydantoinase A